MIDIRLRKASNKWRAQRDALLRDDPWLQRKTDRCRRLAEHAEYIKKYCPEMQTLRGGIVIDIGPGPGEFLEIARHFRHSPYGIDAETGSGGMGDKYLRYSKLMTARQGLHVDYCGLEFWLNNVFTGGTLEWRDMSAGVVLINSRGSIEQAFSEHMEGVPHDVHHNCKMLAWRESGETEDVFFGAFAKFQRLLKPGCGVLIHANGAANGEYYDSVVMRAAEENGFDCVLHEGLVLHKWVKR